MKPIRFDIEFTDEVIAARGGLPLIGRLLGRTAMGRELDALHVEGVGSPTIGHGDVALGMTGLLCLGKPDFAAIEDDARAELIALGLGMEHVPSDQTLRQRLDRIGASRLAEAMTIVRGASAQMVRSSAPAMTACLEHKAHGGSGGRRWVALDVDVSVFDNGGTKKQGVGRTYKGCDPRKRLRADLRAPGRGGVHARRPAARGHAALPEGHRGVRASCDRAGDGRAGRGPFDACAGSDGRGQRCA